MMVSHEEQMRVSTSMIKNGGGFVIALGEALAKADITNAQRIQNAFPDYWEENLKLSYKK